ncbi:MAG: hypothetical protein Q6356_005895 [Candidatus Wukongarchaeota archaeon]|nr:hypothetical protein [Candidatus Wukongarchaeota archaeon]
MTYKGCGKKTKSGKHRKHTPIVSEAQQGFFGAEYARKKAGKKGKTGMSKAELRRHLKESKGKKLPKRSKRS